MSDPSAIDFTLPAFTQALAAPDASAQRKLQIYLGAPVWNWPEWAGTVYPVGSPARDHLKHYSRKFNTVELNSTFYGIPEVQTIRKWAESVAPGFKFAPKWPQMISHSGALGTIQKAVLFFSDRLLEFGETLGLSFLQLPQGFSFSELKSLERFLDFVPEQVPLSVEFRHPSWFENHQLKPQASQLLHSRRVSIVITDTAGRRDAVHLSVSGPSALIRFLGNELHSTDFDRVDAWIDRLQAGFAETLQSLYLIVHQPGTTHVPELVGYIARALNTKYKTLLDEIEISTPGPAAKDQLELW